MRTFAFGVDVGGTAIKLGLFHMDGSLLEKWEIPTRTEHNGEQILPDAVKAIQDAMERHNLSWQALGGVGVGLPGPVTAGGTIIKCVNLGWDIFHVPTQLHALEPRLYKVRVSNDVNAAALGELWQGAARGHRSAFMMTLGTGIGGGLVQNEKIVTGNRGGAGEIGHLCVNPKETEVCTCGNYGCLEQYASASALERAAAKALSENPARPSALRGVTPLTAKAVCDAAREGDELADKLVDQLCGWLGWALATTAAVAAPEIFVVGGGLAQAGPFLLEKIRRSYRRYAFHVFQKTPCVLAELGNDAGIYGCVRMLL